MSEWVQWGTNLLYSHKQLVPIQPLAPAVILLESSPNLTFLQRPCVPLVFFEAWPLTWLIQIAYQLSVKFILPLLGEIWFLVIIYFSEITIRKIFIGKQQVSQSFMHTENCVSHRARDESSRLRHFSPEIVRLIHKVIFLFLFCLRNVSPFFNAFF